MIEHVLLRFNYKHVEPVFFRFGLREHQDIL